MICTAWITAQYLKSINFKGNCYCIGMESMVEELSREGFHISDGIGVMRTIFVSSPFSFFFSLSLQPDPISSDVNWIETSSIHFDDHVCHEIFLLLCSCIIKDGLIKINCVISAFDIHVNYLKIVKAATYLSRPNVLFIATNDDVTTPQNDIAVLPG